ncbi:MAG: PAS domain-containing methyl-accepting chemotaxis protein [Myxococcota bacterium]
MSSDLTFDQLRLALDETQTAMMMVDDAFNVVFLNRATTELLQEHEATFRNVWPGFEASSMLGSCIDRFHKDPSHQRRLLKDPKNLPFQTDIRISHLTFELRVSGRFDASGDLIGHTLEWSDVTLARSRDREVRALRMAVDQAHTAIMMIDPDFIIRYANEATKALLSKHADTFREVWPSFDPDEILGQCIDIFHKRPEHQRTLLADPANLPHRADIKVRDLTFELQVSGQLDHDGKLVGHTLEWSDVTEKRAFELQSLDYRAQVEAVTSTQAVIDFEPSGQVLKANENFLRTMGYELDEIVGLHHRTFVDRSEVENGTNDQLWDRLRRGLPFADQVRRRKRDGSEVYLQAVYVPIPNRNGEIVRVTKVAHDVTDSVRNRHHLQKSVVDLNDSAQEIRQIGDRLGSDVQSISTCSADARVASEEVDRFVQAVAGAVQELSGSIADISETANTAAQRARSGFETSRTVEGTVVNFGAKSQEIGNVVKVITSIAQQTNLLALNATIEAARAGEAGRGFAVVANEVKELAKGTAAATEDIGQKIEAMQIATTDTVQAMQGIRELIEELSGHQEAIASAVLEQRETTQGVGKSMALAADQSRNIVTSMAEVDRLSSAAQEVVTESVESSEKLVGLSRAFEDLLESQNT